MEPLLIPILGIVSSLVLLPGIIGFVVYKNKKNKIEVEKLKLQKEVLELEIRKQEAKTETLRLENQQLDRQINQ
ncbi:MAG: hypothetical protein JW969_15695 [Spirochaetales bacterium]|nr:hypothetical protein [Spirochaetales bacterium]